MSMAYARVVREMCVVCGMYVVCMVRVMYVVSVVPVCVVCGMYVVDCTHHTYESNIQRNLLSTEYQHVCLLPHKTQLISSIVKIIFFYLFPAI